MVETSTKSGNIPAAHNPGGNGFSRIASPEQLQALQDAMHFRTYPKGTRLFWEGEQAGKLFYIRSGRVKLIQSNAEGKDLIVSVLNPGDLIAELGGGEAKYGASAEVMSSAEIGVLDKEELGSVIAEHPDLAVKLMDWVSLSQRAVQAKLKDLLMHGKAGALASILIRLANSCGIPEADGSVRIEWKLTNGELGDMIGATRESVNRMLGEWKAEGILEVVDGKLRILRLERLRTVSGCPTDVLCPSEICRL